MGVLAAGGSGEASGGRIVVQISHEIQDLIPEYLELVRADLKSLGEAEAREDFEAVRILGHNLKGSGAAYGFGVITELGGRLEQVAQTRSGDAVRSLIGELADYLERLEIVFT